MKFSRAWSQFWLGLLTLISYNYKCNLNTPAHLLMCGLFLFLIPAAEKLQEAMPQLPGQMQRSAPFVSFRHVSPLVKWLLME